MDVKVSKPSDYVRSRSHHEEHKNRVAVDDKTNVDGKTNSPSKIFDYLLFRHSTEMGVIGWLAVCFAILNLAWAVKSLTANSADAEMAVVQTTLANQLSFLKICLDHPQLGSQDPSIGMRHFHRRIPCEAFLRSLDFDNMLRLLVDPSMTPDIKLSRKPGNFRKPDPIEGPSFVSLVGLIYSLIMGMFSLGFLKWIVVYLIAIAGFVLAACVYIFTLGVFVVGFKSLRTWWQNR